MGVRFGVGAGVRFGVGAGVRFGVGVGVRARARVRGRVRGRERGRVSVARPTLATLIFALLCGRRPPLVIPPPVRLGPLVISPQAPLGGGVVVHVVGAHVLLRLS